MAPLIEARDLRIRFGVAEAVGDIDFHIDDGEVLGGIRAAARIRADRI
jgi:ABC-type branched-subunit amino acid transport system ATPase component